MSGMGGGGLAREVVDMELQNAIQLNDLLVIQDMVQVCVNSISPSLSFFLPLSLASFP